METKLEALSSEEGPPPPPPPLEILSFGVALPPSTFQAWEEPEVKSTTNDDSGGDNLENTQRVLAAAALLNQQGIVGTIVILKNAVMIWFGWGRLIRQEASEDASITPLPPPSNSATSGGGVTVGSGTLYYYFHFFLNCATYILLVRSSDYFWIK
jgi:hypothetical protein